MKIQLDKILHLESCALIVLIVSHFFPFWIGTLAASIIGIGKEIFDIKYGVPSWKDLIFDFIGVLLGTVIALM